MRGLNGRRENGDDGLDEGPGPQGPGPSGAPSDGPASPGLPPGGPEAGDTADGTRPGGPGGSEPHGWGDDGRRDAQARRRVWAVGSSTVAGLAAIGLLATAACSTGGTGARDAGPAPTDQAAPSMAAPVPTASASPTLKRVDAVRLIKNDPKVSDRVKADLKPCDADVYPVDTSYGNLTNSGPPDVVVNVLTCGDAVGIGTYVYRPGQGGERPYENVFTLEEPAVYSTIDRGDLIVTKQRYERDDPVAYPSGEDVITFRWAGDRFTQHDIVQTEYSKAVGGDLGGPVPTAPDGN